MGRGVRVLYHSISLNVRLSGDVAGERKRATVGQQTMQMKTHTSPEVNSGGSVSKNMDATRNKRASLTSPAQ